MIDMENEIGNPVFAIETNLECLRTRIGRMDTGELRGPDNNASEAYEICDAIQTSLEKIKAAIRTSVTD